MASDMIYDFQCSPCDDKSFNAEAMYYCANCSKFYCEKCVFLHNQLFQNHTTYGTQERDKWGFPLKELCLEHEDKEIDMYCEDHNALCCNLCATLFHRTCTCLVTITEAATKGKGKINFKKLPPKVQQTNIHIDQAKEAKEANLHKLTVASSTTDEELAQLRDNLHNMVDAMFNRTQDVKENVCTSIGQKIHGEIHECSKMQRELSRLCRKPGKNLQDNVQTFIRFKKCEDMLEKANIMLQVTTPLQYAIKFEPDRRLEHYLSSMETFGEFKTTPEVGTGSKEVYNVLQKHSYQVSEGGEEICTVTGCCQMPTGRYILVDQVNSKLKLVDDRFNMISHCVMPSFPYNICRISDDQAAVTICNQDGRREVAIVTVAKGKMKVMRRFQTTDKCYALAYFHGHLYIGSLNAIFLYNLEGRVLGKIYEDLGGQQTVKKIAISNDGHKLYVTNQSGSSLVTLDNRGKKLAILDEGCFKNPVGLCVARNGTVFVCEMENKVIIQINEAGTKVLDIMQRDDPKTIYQQSLWFNSDDSLLIIGQHSPEVAVLKMGYGSGSSAERAQTLQRTQSSRTADRPLPPTPVQSGSSSGQTKSRQSKRK